MVDDDWRVDFGLLKGRNAVTIGNVNNNHLLLVLYGERYVVADSVYPGKGGFVIKTVHDPLAKGINVLVLAGSDLEGTARAARAFVEEFMSRETEIPLGGRRSLVLPRPVVKVEFKREVYRFFPPPSPKRRPQYTPMEWFKKNLRKAGFMDGEGRIVRNNCPLCPLVGRFGGTSHLDR